MSDEETTLLGALLGQLSAAPGSDEALGHLMAHAHDVELDDLVLGVIAISRTQPLEVAAKHVAAIGQLLLECHPAQPGDAARGTLDWARDTCERALAEVSEIDEPEVWQLVLASAAFRGEWDVAAIVMQMSGGGHGDAECPHCNRPVAVASDGRAVRLLKPSGDGGELIEAPARTPVEELVRLSALARGAGQLGIAGVLDTLNGSAGCPYCKRACSVWSALLEPRA